MVDQFSNDSLDSVLNEGFIVGESEGSWCDVYPLHATSKLTVGRDGRNDIVITDERCSRRHCVFRKSRGHWYVCDLDSINGTYVNGNRIRRNQKLRPGDRIRVASQKLMYAATVVDPSEVIANLVSGFPDAAAF